MQSVLFDVRKSEIGSAQIIGQDGNEFFGRKRPGIRISGNIAKVNAVLLFPIGVKECSYAVLDRIRRYVEILGGGLIECFAGKKRAVFF